VDTNGTYAFTVRPGRHYVEVTVSPNVWGYTTPNTGDEATDSDATLVHVSDLFATAQSDTLEVTSGSEWVVDVGLNEVTTA
jgi:hypothetical protein